MPNPDLEARNAAREPGPQPDPMLNEGRASYPRKWAVTAVIAAVLLAVMYGVTAHRAEVQDEHRASQMQRDANPPSTQPAQGGGRGTSNAPTAPPVTNSGG